MSRGGRLSSLLVAVVVAALLLPAAAIAGSVFVIDNVNLGSSHGLNYRSATFPSAPSSSIVNAAANCPSQRRLTGGGAYISGNVTEAWVVKDSPWEFLFKTIPPTSHTKTWAASMTNRAGNPKDLTSYAICAKHAGLHFVSRPKHGIPDGDVGTVSIKCPKGTSVTGGGAFSTGLQDQILTTRPFDSADKGHKPDDGWKVRDRPVGGSADVTVDAICSGKLKLAYRNDEIRKAGSQEHQKASCPKDSAVTGGGASLSGGAEAFLNTSYPIDRGDPGDVPDDGWQSHAGILSGGTRTLRVFAICKL